MVKKDKQKGKVQSEIVARTAKCIVKCHLSDKLVNVCSFISLRGSTCSSGMMRISLEKR